MEKGFISSQHVLVTFPVFGNNQKCTLVNEIREYDIDMRNQCPALEKTISLRNGFLRLHDCEN